MSFEDPEIISNILYFIREKYFHHAMTFINDGIKRYGNEPCLKLLTGICLIYEERYSEAIRDLENLTDKSEVAIGAYYSLQTAFKKSKKTDQHDCDNKVRELRKSPSDLGFHFAAMTLFLFERYDKAREYLVRAMKTTTYTKEMNNLLGWIDIMSSKESNHKNAENCFDKANSLDDGKNIDSLLGKVKCLETQGQYKAALDVINKLIVSNGRFLPALLEKMHLQLIMISWDEVYDTAGRCLIINSGCIEALKHQILKVLCMEGLYEETSTKIGELLQMLDKYEPKNAYQYHRCAILFSRICGRNSFILQQCIYLEERALNLCPDSIEYNNGMGSILLLQGKNREAIKSFKISMSLDEANLKAIQGIIACQLNENMLKEASTQLEFLNEVQANIEKSAELKYLTAVIKRKQRENEASILHCLDECIQIHFSSISNMQLSVNYVYLLNPDFMIQIVQEYMKFCPKINTNNNTLSSSNSASNDNSILKRNVQILEQIYRFLPGLQKAGFLLARCYFMMGNFEKSKTLLESCLEADQAFSDGHILMAQIHLQNGNYKLADHALEVGVSHNFQVCNNPLFYLMKGRILLRQSKSQEAKQILQKAFNLPGVKMINNNNTINRSNKTDQDVDLSISDRLSIYLELAEALRQTGEIHESTKILQDAQTDFMGTEEEARITISNAEMAVQRGDIETALTILCSVGHDHAYFVEARKAMAHIYLKYRKDKKLYAACFKELVERHRTPHNLVLLGDAYMEIQQADKAIKLYQEASEMKEGDLELIGKMGLALVKTHNYTEAIKYYKKVVRSGQTSLRKDLCRLFINLKMFDDAKSVLIKGIQELSKASDYASNTEVVQLYLLLADVSKCLDDTEKEISQLEEARNIQMKVLKKVVVENPDSLVVEKKLATEINLNLSQCYIKLDQINKAIELFEETRTKLNANDSRTLLEISKLKMRLGDVDGCQQECLALLKLEDDLLDRLSGNTNTNNESANVNYASEATIMMAELMIQKLDFDTALIHLKKLVTKDTTQYKALALMIDVLRRNGELEDAAKYFKNIREADPKQENSPGYKYCYGLYEWYLNNSSEALKCFSLARADSECKTEAIINMIELCINPDNDTIGGDVLTQVDQTSGSSGSEFAEEGAKSALNNIRTAEEFLQHLPNDEPRTIYLQHMIYTATKQKSLIDKAHLFFSESLKEHPDNILYNYGAAVANLMNKQTSKARSHLNVILNIAWTKQYAEEHEKTWLLMAEICIQNKNFQDANEYLKNCIKHNKSCYKAYEYKGLISEKEQNYKEAASNYYQAWIHCHKNNPAIGYKLAFNFLRTHRYVDSIDVCLDVLKSNPKYPKIRKDILDKARLSVRV